MVFNINEKDFKKALKQLDPNKAKSLSAEMLTHLGNIGLQNLKKSQAKNMTLRNNYYKNGFVFFRASASKSISNQNVVLGHKAEAMLLQEEGGVVTDSKGGNLSIATLNSRIAKSGSRKVSRPLALDKLKNKSTVRIKSNVFVRKGKKLVLVRVLKKSRTVKATNWFSEGFLKSANETLWLNLFTKYFNKYFK